MLPHNGLETIIVMMRTTPPSVDLMEEIVVITKWRATPTTAVLANAWTTQVNFNLSKVMFYSMCSLSQMEYLLLYERNCLLEDANRRGEKKLQHVNIKLYRSEWFTRTV